MLKKIFLFFFIFLFLAHPSYAAAINEFLPSPVSGDSEWVEFYNPDGVDLKSFYIDDDLDFASDSGSSVKKSLSSLVENNLQYPYIELSSILNNSGDIVALFDSSGNLVDSYEYTSNPGSGVTLGRSPDGTGSFISQIFITKGAANPNMTPTPQPVLTLTPTSTPIQSGPTPSPIATLVPSSSSAPTSSPAKYSNIYLSEVMVNPNTSENEWVEIYNGNNFSVNLTDWSIDDIESGGSSPKTIAVDIAPYGFGVITFSSSIFNNDGDSVRLLNVQKEVVDSFSYKEAVKGQSIGRTSFNETAWCNQEPSPALTNKGCLLELQKFPSSTPAPTLALLQTFDSSSANYSSLPLSAQLKLDTQNFNLSQPTSKSEKILNGEVLGTNESEYDENDSQVVYIKGFTTSAFSLSLFNIFYIIHKVFKKGKYEEN